MISRKHSEPLNVKKNFMVTPYQQEMLSYICQQHNMTESEMLRKLIEWEWEFVNVWNTGAE